MKISTILLLFTFLQVSAEGLSQTVTLSKQNASLKTVLKTIQKQTGYDFIMTKEQLAESRKVNLNVRNVSLEKALNVIFKDQPFNYTLLNKTIVLNLKHKKEVEVKKRGVEIEVMELVPPIQISGTVTDVETNEPLAGVTVRVQGTTNGTVTDENGQFLIEAEDDAVLEISFVGYSSLEVPVNGRSSVAISMESSATGLDQLVVVGFGVEKKSNIIGAISNIGSEDINRTHGGSTVSTTLAGKVSGLSFRQSEGRPGASANIQIRNFGDPLYVIDGIVRDVGQFNNILPEDIESISVLKDASSAAIYGARASNGVVIVTTKKGAIDQKPEVNVNAYYGVKNVTRYPNDVMDGYNWMLYSAEAEVNESGKTNITKDELDRWKKGEGFNYRSFDWPKFIFRRNVPQYSLNANVSGGGNTTTYYISFGKKSEEAAFRQYTFDRTNIQSNIETRVGERIKVGLNLNGRIERGANPGVPGADDYGQPLLASLRNLPREHPYANDNPNFLGDIGHNNSNAGLWTFDRSGKRVNIWRVLGADFHGEYDLPVSGLSVKGVYSYFFANNDLQNHEFTYDAYTYDENNDEYIITGGSSNPFQERGQTLMRNVQARGQIDYSRSLNSKHNLEVTLLTEWYRQKIQSNRIHDVPAVNELDLIQLSTIDTYEDFIGEEARIGYVGRVNYNYQERYYFEFSGREDGSWKWPPNKRWGFFPSIAIGWRLTEESFFKRLKVSKNGVLDDIKVRFSYGLLGDDNVDIDNFGFISGYNYAAGTFIDDGDAIVTSEYRGIPITNITWLKSRLTNVGLDYSILKGSINGSIEYFYRKKSGLLDRREGQRIPKEIGYEVPLENLNTEAQIGGEFSINYTNQKKEFKYSLGLNLNLSRRRFLHSFNPSFGNSWDQYRNSIEDRWNDLFWGYRVVGQFESIEQIKEYPVDIDGLGNSSILPGDLIYEDVNNDGIINELDERPIGYNTTGNPSLYGGLDIPVAYEGRIIKPSGGSLPSFYGGFSFNAEWRDFDISLDLSFGSMYSFNRTSFARVPFNSGGNLLKDFANRWHRNDIFDPESSWIPGKNPPLRFNASSHSNYNRNSSFWLTNIRQLRFRTLEFGYKLPKRIIGRIALNNVRVYLNFYNLFSFDNLKKEANFLDPETSASNGFQYPQTRVMNFGFNLKF